MQAGRFPDRVWAGLGDAVGLSRETHRLTVAATDASGNTDPTPAHRTFAVPMFDTDLNTDSRWKHRSAAAAYGSGYATASHEGATITAAISNAREVALIVTKWPGQGGLRV